MTDHAGREDEWFHDKISPDRSSASSSGSSFAYDMPIVPEEISGGVHWEEYEETIQSPLHCSRESTDYENKEKTNDILTQPSTPPQLSSKNQEECWICTSGRTTATDPIIYNVCQCTGTSSAVHQRCINDLVLVYGHSHCSVCHSVYCLEYPDELRKLSEAQKGFKFRALLKHLLLPLICRVIILLCWVAFSFILVPFAVGSIYYYDQLQGSSRVDGKPNQSLTHNASSDLLGKMQLDRVHQRVTDSTTSIYGKQVHPHITEKNDASMNSVPTELAAWWWVYIYAWVLGTALGAVFRCVMYSWGSWKTTYLTPRVPDVEAEGLPNLPDTEIEDESGTHGFGQASQVFNFVKEAEQFVGYNTLEKVTLVHILLGSLISLIFSSRQWALILLAVMVLCIIWEKMSKKYSPLDPLRSFSELEEMKKTFTRQDILELFSRTVLRFTAIILLSGFCTFFLHVMFCSLFQTTGSAKSVVRDINVIRLIAYYAVGFFFSIGMSAFDSAYMSPIFALGTSFTVFHSTQTTEELQRRLLDALAVRALSSHPCAIIFRSITYMVPFFLVIFFFFAIPASVLFGVRGVYWGDSIVSHSPGRFVLGLPIHEAAPAIAGGPLPPPNPGEVELPLHIGLFHWTPEAFTAGGMMLYDWVRHMQHHLRHMNFHGSDSTPPPTTTQAMDVSLDVFPMLNDILSELKQATRAGHLCQWVWEQVLLEVESEDSESTSMHQVIGPPLYSLSSNVGKHSVKPLVYNRSSSNAITCQVAAVLFAGYVEEHMAKAIIPKFDITRIINFSRKARWWTAHYMLQYPLALNWLNNFAIVSLFFIAMYCISSVELYRLHLRQMYYIASVLGWLFGLEDFLFTEEIRTNMETFLSSGDEVSEVIVPESSIDLLFALREEIMDPALLPSCLKLRRFLFFLVYYPCMVLVLWEAPLCGAVVCVGLTTQVVPLLTFSTCLFFAVWRPKYFFQDALPSGFMLALSLVLIICYVVVIQPIVMLFAIRWNDLVTSSVMRAKGLRPKVVPRSRGTQSNFFVNKH